MPPLRGAKINSGFLLVRRRFDLLLFRGAQLIATMHTYFCSRPRKIAAATFTHPPTNPPRLLFFHYVCAGPRALCQPRRARTTLFDQRSLLPLIFLLLIPLVHSLSYSFSYSPSSSSFPFRSAVPLLSRGKLAAIAVARFSRNRDYQNHATTCCSA